MKKIRLIYDRRKKASKNKKGSVTVEVTEDGVRKWVSTGISCYPNQWCEKRWVVNHYNTPSKKYQLIM